MYKTSESLACDPVGHWKVSATWARGTCKKKGTSDELDFYVVKSGNSVEVRVRRGQKPQLVDIEKTEGKCVLRVREDINQCASCNTVEMAYHDFTLREIEGSVEGELQYWEGDWENRLSPEGAACTQSAILAGTKTAIKSKDLALDAKDIRRRFITLRDNCRYSLTGLIRVKLLIRPNGGIDKLWLNGKEMLEECQAPRLDIWVDSASFPNPSGEQGFVSFKMKFPPPSCKEQCARDGACRWVKSRCAPTSSSHCRRSAACTSAGKCSLQRGACVLRLDSDCRRTRRCRSDKECFFFDGRCVTREFKKEAVAVLRAEEEYNRAQAARERLIERLENVSLAQRERAAIRLCRKAAAVFRRAIAKANRGGSVSEKLQAKVDNAKEDYSLAEALFRGIAEQMAMRGASRAQRRRLQSSYSRNCSVR